MQKLRKKQSKSVLANHLFVAVLRRFCNILKSWKKRREIFNLREEQQYFGKESSKSVWLFPINRAALEKSFADQITAYDEHHSANVTMNGVNVPVDAATKEESETLLRYLESLTNCPLDDSQITSIVSEEAGKYFAGDCTAESAAKAIQGRVSLYLSEQG